MNSWFKELLDQVYLSEVANTLDIHNDYVTLPIPIINRNRVFLVVSFCDQKVSDLDNLRYLFPPRATAYVNPIDYNLTWRYHNPNYFNFNVQQNQTIGFVDRSHIHSVEEWKIIEMNFYENLLDLTAYEWLLKKNRDIIFENRVAFHLRSTLTILQDDILLPYYSKIRKDLNNWILSVL